MTPRVGRRLGILLLSLSVLVPAVGRGGDQPLASDVRGKGEPTVVLIHGLGQDWRIWDRVSADLETKHRVVRVDLPGHGQSPPTKKIGIDAATEALERALQKRKVKGAVLVGHSYGGLVALAEAAARPERAAGVVVIDIPSSVRTDSASVAALDDMLENRYALFLRGVFAAMTVQDTLADTLLAMANRVSRDVLTSYFREAWNLDLRPRVAKVRAPILLVATPQTWPPGESWTSARKRLGYESAGPAIGRRIDRSGHLIPLDQPDTLATAIAEFSATLAPARR
jgi:pimeloyl-ACP methyl ester carboxylesterase